MMLPHPLTAVIAVAKECIMLAVLIVFVWFVLATINDLRLSVKELAERVTLIGGQLIAIQTSVSRPRRVSQREAGTSST